MKQLLNIFLFTFILIAGASAQGNNPQGGKFSPEKFEADLHDYIVREAHLTCQEEAKFFPVYREMQQKQRAIYDSQRQLSTQKPQDEEACKKAIRERDEKDILLRRIQLNYHQRFLELLPASKVWDILKAEERFHRRTMKNWGQQHKPQGQGQRSNTHQK